MSSKFIYQIQISQWISPNTSWTNAKVKANFTQNMRDSTSDIIWKEKLKSLRNGCMRFYRNITQPDMELHSEKRARVHIADIDSSHQIK